MEPIKFTQSFERTPKPCFWAEHDGAKLIRIGFGQHVSPKQVICADTEEERAVAIAGLSLAPLPLTRRQKAAARFTEFPAEVQAQFAPVLAAVSAIQSEADVLRAVAATPVSEELQQYKDQLVSILSAA